MTEKQNCWEIKGCGREPGGLNARQNVCPAAAEEKSSGINGGRCAGRHCWRIAGTSCDGEVQGTFAQKVDDCGDCEVFKQVVREEGLTFQI